ALARVGIVGPQDVDPRPGVANDVVGEGDIFDRRPGSAAVLVTDGQLQGEAVLSGPPNVLEDVAFHQHPPGILQFEEVLDGPGRTRISRIALPPRQGLEEVVLPDLDVGRHETVNRGVRAAEHDVLARPLQMVVDDLEGTGPVPAHDGLGVGADSQAIMGWNGPGPFKIVNNHLEGAGENVMFGGADPPIHSLVPSDIEIRQNHFFKPLSWREGDPTYAGTPWTIKNLFELKNARRVLVEGNVFENIWRAAQDGFALQLTVRNQYGGAPWSTIE